MWQIKNIIAQVSLRLQSLNMMEIHIKIKHYHCHMVGDFTLWSSDIEKIRSVTFKKAATTKLGRNACQNERVSLLHVTWPNYTKVNRITTLKFALTKGTHSYWPGDLWLHNILINEERHITILQILEKLSSIKFIC